MNRVLSIISIMAIAALAQPDNKAPVQASSQSEAGYRIDQPGTITFTVGIKIKGKVEKPQVMIFLPKEKSIFKEIVLDHSFKKEILEPLPFVPITE